MRERIDAASLRTFSEALCCAAGLSTPDAALLSDSIVFAECRGVTSHGLLRLPQYIARLRSGATAMNVSMPFTMESGGTARLDAQNGLGQLAGRKAAAKAEELAGEYGVSFVAVANSNHFGTGAWYAIPAAQRGFFAFNISSAASAMAPHGAAQPLLGTDPIGLALPRGEGKTPLALDMALSTVARGKIRYAALSGTPIPDTWGLDAHGAPTTDASAVLRGGTLLPAGGAKGSGLAIFIELLCAVLTGSSALGGAGLLSDLSRPAGTGHVFGCVDISAFCRSKPLRSCARRASRASPLSPRRSRAARFCSPASRRSAVPPRALLTACRSLRRFAMRSTRSPKSSAARHDSESDILNPLYILEGGRIPP